MKLERFRKYFITVMLIAIIFTPLALQLLSRVTHKDMDVELKGYFDEYQQPAFTGSGFVSGEFQQGFEAWLNNNIQPRNCMIMLYNQCQYSLFDQGNGILGSDGYLFEPMYVEAELCLNGQDYSIPEREAEIAYYVQMLDEINYRLSLVGKHLFVYTTSSKAHWFRDNIPSSYQVQAVDGVRAVDCFKRYISQTNIPYLDTDDILATMEYPTFYRTGIHWSRPTEQTVSVNVLNRVQSLTGANYCIPSLGDMEVSSEPYERDTDIYDLENLIVQNLEDNYYQYNWVEPPMGDYEPLDVIIQGGSFANGLMYDYFLERTENSMYYINYRNFVMSNRGEYTPINSWEELNLQYMLDRSDVVIIEINEAVLHNYSDGFAEYLNGFLTGYVPSNVVTSLYDTNLDANMGVGLSSSEGFYNMEAGHIWASPDCEVTLLNSEIGTSGLELEFFINENCIVDGSDVLDIYVNDVLVNSYVAHEQGTVNLIINPDQFEVTPDGIYSVRITSSNYFNPHELGAGDDDRDLAVSVAYIGARR